MAVSFKFKADGTGYTKGLEKMRGQTRKWSSNIGKMVAGAFAFGAIINGFRTWTQSLNETAKAAKLLSTTAQEMEKLAFVAEKGKVEFDDLKEFISNVNERVFEGAIQAGHMADEWSALGVKGAELKDKSPVKVMSMLSDEFRKTGDKASFAAAGIALFGDDFKRVINVLEMGGTTINNLSNDAAITSERTRKSIERLSQTWIDFKNKSVEVFDSIVGIFQTIGEAVGALINQFGLLFDYVINQATVAGRIFKNAFKGDLDAVSAEIDNFKRNNKMFVFETSANFTALGGDDPKADGLTEEDFRKATGQTDEPLKDEPKEGKEFLDKQIKDNEKILKLKERIAEIEKKAGLDAMNLKEKGIALTKEAVRLGNIANDETIEGLKAYEKLLDIEKQIEAVEKARADKTSEDTEEKRQEKEDAEKHTQGLRDELASLQESAKVDAMSDQEKINFYKDKEQEALTNAREFANAGDEDKALEAQIEAENIGGTIAGLESGISNDPMIPSIIASGLASIGGGGGVAAFGNDPALATQNKQLGVLEKIEAHLNPSSGLDTAKNLETPEL